MSFLAELRRRNVVKVGLTYAVAAWLLIQMVTTVMPTFDAPAWIAQTITFLLILGLPFVLVFAWAFEITPGGLKKTADVDPAESLTPVTGQRLNYLIVGLLALAVGLIVFDRYLGGNSATGPLPAEAAGAAPAAPAATEAASLSTAANDTQLLPNSVAVLPLANLSPRAEDAYFAAGIHDEILNQLVKLKSLNVIARTSVLQYANTSKTIQEIGRELGVQTVLEGSVRYADERVLVTAQLIDAATNVHLWSESYERPFSNIFAIQADVAMSVANALRAEFTAEEQESLERLPTSSLEAYELYLTAQDSSLSPNGQVAAIEALEKALALDPAFVQAWVLKANLHGFRAQTASAARYVAEDEAMVAAAARAVELAPEMPEAQVLLAAAHGRRGEWLAAEAAFQRTNAAPAAAARQAVHAFSVGDLERAQDLSAIARRTDPFNGTVRGFYLLGFSLVGDFERAEQEYARGISAFGNPWPLGSWFITMARVRPGHPLSRDEVPPGIGRASAQNYVRDYLDDPQASLARLRETASDATIGIDHLSVIALWAAYFGDPELSLVAIERATTRNAQNAFLLWLPVMRDVRQLPRFKAFVAEVGLVDYWRQYGWPTLCRAKGDDFTCS